MKIEEKIFQDWNPLKEISLSRQRDPIRGNWMPSILTPPKSSTKYGVLLVLRSGWMPHIGSLLP